MPKYPKPIYQRFQTNLSKTMPATRVYHSYKTELSFFVKCHQTNAMCKEHMRLNKMPFVQMSWQQSEKPISHDLYRLHFSSSNRFSCLKGSRKIEKKDFWGKNYSFKKQLFAKLEVGSMFASHRPLGNFRCWHGLGYWCCSEAIRLCHKPPTPRPGGCKS